MKEIQIFKSQKDGITFESFLKVYPRQKGIIFEMVDDQRTDNNKWQEKDALTDRRVVRHVLTDAQLKKMGLNQTSIVSELLKRSQSEKKTRQFLDMIADNSSFIVSADFNMPTTYYNILMRLGSSGARGIKDTFYPVKARIEWERNGASMQGVATPQFEAFEKFGSKKIEQAYNALFGDFNFATVDGDFFDTDALKYTRNIILEEENKIIGGVVKVKDIIESEEPTLWDYN